jgi:hypothetical protein
MCAPDVRGAGVCRQSCRSPDGWLGAVTARLSVQRGDYAGSLGCYYHVLLLFFLICALSSNELRSASVEELWRLDDGLQQRPALRRINGLLLSCCLAPSCSRARSGNELLSASVKDLRRLVDGMRHGSA